MFPVVWQQVPACDGFEEVIVLSGGSRLGAKVAVPTQRFAVAHGLIFHAIFEVKSVAGLAGRLLPG